MAGMKSMLVLLSVAASAVAQQTAYGQYYSQCVPGTNTVVPTTSKSTSNPTTTPTSKPTGTPTTASPTTSTLPVSSSGSTGPIGPLQSGYYWIRAVEAPNFHKYLQSAPLNSAGRAVLDSYTTAAQLQIDSSGQLIQKVSSSSVLYANVQPNTTAGANKLSMSFSTTKGTYGTFSWSGDALQWSVAGLSRPNLSAWLVCENQNLYVNLGNYAYMTPAGCVDETIHYYNAATPNS